MKGTAGATTHTTNTTPAFVQQFFCERIVWRGLWPPRSPDLTPPDFFPKGFLKERLYLNNPGSLEEPEHNIEQIVANTNPETLCKIARNTLKRVDACLREGDGHFQHLL
jgi:hypothetical protein